MAGSNTKNLGQVAGIAFSSTEPTNTGIIWYDTTPSVMTHKVYDTGLGRWVAINNSILVNITYNELRNLAQAGGLTLGTFYVITNQGNLLAVAISTTKVQYTDATGNIVIDDLGTNQQYHIPANNITLDGLAGTFDDATKTLLFDFEASTPNSGNLFNSYLFGKTPVTGSTWKLFKTRISALLSTASNNAISWNNGFYFNFAQSLLDSADRAGGTVSYNTFIASQELQDQNIQNIDDNYASLSTQLANAINVAVTNEQIMSKQLVSLTPNTGKVNLAVGDTLTQAFNKIQGWITLLQNATNILVGNYTIPTSQSQITSTDTVNQALAKLNRLILDAAVNDGAIGTNQLADRSVVRQKIGLLAVGSDELGNNAVIKGKIGNGAVVPNNFAEYWESTYARMMLTCVMRPDNGAFDITTGSGAAQYWHALVSGVTANISGDATNGWNTEFRIQLSQLSLGSFTVIAQLGQLTQTNATWTTKGPITAWCSGGTINVKFNGWIASEANLGIAVTLSAMLERTPTQKANGINLNG